MDQISDYLEQFQRTLAEFDRCAVDAGFGLLAAAANRGGTIYVCGNGGSASTASHFAADLGKHAGRYRGRFRVASLTDNAAWLTALSNDLNFANCFAGQIRDTLEPADLLVGISASGNSPNVLEAFHLARRAGVCTLALLGFDGGKLGSLATQTVCVRSFDYGIVESLHAFITHAWVHQMAAIQPAASSGRPHQVHDALLRFQDPPSGTPRSLPWPDLQEKGANIPANGPCSIAIAGGASAITSGAAATKAVLEAGDIGSAGSALAPEKPSLTSAVAP